ncbi:MAG: hypothetical protein KatS3mg105_0211 [Gemmatales bacterium]|nr:MAG: hypothetical protein KatS3mg105_0211 [Gemmatales bacterium]
MTEEQQTETVESEQIEARAADFPEVASSAAPDATASLDRLLDVNVSVTAELGRTTLTIGDILKLGVGSVLQLNRSVSEPVDLVVQGVRLARGEVVVVDDRFAVRIKEVIDPKKAKEPG